VRNRFFLAGAVTMLALWVRLPVLHQGLWEDEATAVYAAESPTIHEFFRRQTRSDSSPPLFNAVLAGYGRVFGFSEIPVKALAIGIGALAAGAIALAAAEGFGMAGGIIAGFFAIVHPLLIDMSAEVRPYSLAALTTAACLWSLFRYRRRRLEGRARAVDLALFGCLALLAAESHYSGTIMVMVVGAFAAAASLRRKWRGLWLPVAAAASCVGLVLLPWAPIAWRQMHVGLPWAPRSQTVTYLEMSVFKSSALLPASARVPGILLPLALALCFAALLAMPDARARLRVAGSAIALPLAAAAAAFFAIGVAGPVTRYVTVPAALVTIVLGGMLGIVLTSAVDAGRLERAFAVAGVVGLLFWSGRQGVTKMKGMFADQRAGRSRSLIRDLCGEGLFRGGDLVVVTPDMIGPTFWYYLPPGILLRGLVHWSEPALVDFSDYPSKWKDPRLIDDIAAALDRDLRSNPVRRILLTYAVGNDNPLPFRTRTKELRSLLAGRFRLDSSNIYRGPADVIQIDVFAVARR
jgi:hypothetical protein